MEAETALNDVFRNWLQEKLPLQAVSVIREHARASALAQEPVDPSSAAPGDNFSHDDLAPDETLQC